MPYEIEKVKDRCWRVYNKETGVEHAKCTSKKNAMAQMRLLYMKEREKEQGKGSEPVDMPVAPEPKPEMGMGAARKSWKTFYGEGVKGKKFGSRTEVNEFMKEMAAKFRATKK